MSYLHGAGFCPRASVSTRVLRRSKKNSPLLPYAQFFRPSVAPLGRRQQREVCALRHGALLLKPEAHPGIDQAPTASLCRQGDISSARGGRQRASPANADRQNRRTYKALGLVLNGRSLYWSEALPPALKFMPPGMPPREHGFHDTALNSIECNPVVFNRGF